MCIEGNLGIYVTAAGLRAGNTRFTFVLARVGSGPVYMSGHYGNLVFRYGDEYYFTLIGRHALASPKGGGPCSLGTFTYGVTSHLAFRLT